MIRLRTNDRDLKPIYMTEWSAGADLRSAQDMSIEPAHVARVPTGVWIESHDLKNDQDRFYELQVRCRSSLAFKHQIMLANGVGTIDLDYPDEIGVLLYNFGQEIFQIKRGDRIAQIVLTTVQRIPGLSVGGQRTGGFGSTQR